MSGPGIPHVLVNNAGIDQPPSPSGGGYRLDEIPFDVNRRIFEVNTLGLFQVAQIFGSDMVKAGRGSVINIGSLYASVSPDPRFYDHIESDPPFLKPPAYGASKAAVVNLTKYLATAWGPHGVRVNTLSPGGVLGAQDEQFKRKFCDRVPLGRMAVHQRPHRSAAISRLRCVRLRDRGRTPRGWGFHGVVSYRPDRLLPTRPCWGSSIDPVRPFGMG